MQIWRTAAHQAVFWRGGRQAEPDDHGLGRSRGGWTVKAMLSILT
ncbi:hypothetical protein ABZW32_30285 [Streptomyces sp. NPDC004667]